MRRFCGAGADGGTTVSVVVYGMECVRDNRRFSRAWPRRLFIIAIDGDGYFRMSNSVISVNNVRDLTSSALHDIKRAGEPSTVCRAAMR